MSLGFPSLETLAEITKACQMVGAQVNLLSFVFDQNDHRDACIPQMCCQNQQKDGGGGEDPNI